MHTIKTSLIALFAFLCALGCGLSEEGGQGSDPDAEPVEPSYFENEGTVCLMDEPHGPQNDRSHVDAGEPFEITVLFADCLSGCAEVRDTSCEIEVDGDEIALTSEGSYVDRTSEEGGCPDVCVVASATCDVPGLDEGSYTLEHGDMTYAFDVPGDEDEPACLEE